MKHRLCWLILVSLLLLPGCRGDKDKDINKGLDRPQSPPAEKKTP